LGLLGLHRQQSALKNLTILGGRVKSEYAKKKRRFRENVNKKVSS
jgi:hypothetical protein